MYYITKRIEISAAHRLRLGYESKCSRIHGHNWIVTVYCKSKELDANGMVTDFSHIKTNLREMFDHKLLNDVVSFNPTAENLARHICGLIPNCWRVDIQESEGNTASYVIDE